MSFLIDFQIKTDRWQAVNVIKKQNTWILDSNNRAFSNIKHYEYEDNSEWNFLAYKFSIDGKTSLINQKKFSTLTVRLGVQRHLPYYWMTMFVPILVMTIIAPCGLLLPGNLSGKNLTKSKISPCGRENGPPNNDFIVNDYLCWNPAVKYSSFWHLS